MSWKRPIRMIALAAVAMLGIAADTPWHATVAVSERAHTIGNPAAEVTLTEFVSYSCPHCATFAMQGDPALQLAYIGTGKVKVEVRPVIRNSVDTVATLLAQCGGSDRFMRNHSMFMLTQRNWLSVAQRASQGQIARWTAADKPAARRAIANDLGFYALMESRGYSRVEIDQCLSDNSKAERLEANTEADFEEFGVTSTPSFAIDGKLLDHVHEWQSLEAKLNERF
jgi:protein-disulfide isomerase